MVGSTGSIGTQTLDIISRNPDLFEAVTLIGGSRLAPLVEQALAYRPRRVVIADEAQYGALAAALEGSGIAAAAGSEAILAEMEADDVDMVVTATVGYSGLFPTLRAIASGKDIALANKETLVVGGELIERKLRESRSRI
ncbi:MAG: 1-deoxy-D-xylulose-5-phosphate reductoisomerase, partial [Muribaculaceae bacterium]|nr:1-deoxy-D-xylulose-5-phosphate reductoisomerase [Muribaculaceae bacterium]